MALWEGPLLGKNREQFFDLDNDPFEMENLVNSQSHVKKLDQFRQNLLDWCRETNDTKFMKKLIIPSNSTLLSRDLFDKSY